MPPWQPDLFQSPQGVVRQPSSKPSRLISGLVYESDFISPRDEETLVGMIDQAPWLNDLKRRVQHYGWRYDYKARRIDRKMYLGDLPTWLDAVSRQLIRPGWFESKPDQAIVNEYQPGQGIAPHIDCVPCFGGTVASVSLMSDVIMDFLNPHTGETQSQLLEPRSAIILSGDARCVWRHGIAPRLKDMWDGYSKPRSRRISITFRTIVENVR